jgi:hypothetical protein
LRLMMCQFDYIILYSNKYYITYNNQNGNR